MKTPSLFRIPRYQRFRIEPRYYDPVKEEVEKKERAIAGELSAGKDEIERPHFSSRINGAFSRKKSSDYSATFTQLIIMTVISSFLASYLYYGNVALYIFAPLSALLLFLRLKRII